MKFADLIKKNKDIVAGAEIVVVTTVDDKKIDVYTNNKDIDLTRNEALPPACWKDLARDYAAKYGIPIADCLRDAIIARAGKKKVLTLREAEVLHRREAKLDNDFIWAALLVTGMHVVEDNWFSDDCMYTVRIRYNRGLDMKKKGWQGLTPEQVARGEALLISLPKRLEDVGLPLYPFEFVNGFQEDLLRPEVGRQEVFFARQKAIWEGKFE
jgi:hypothetical protein